MTKTLIGLDYTGTACVKITKGSYDPVTTPDGEVSKFLYSSKWAADCKIAALFRGLPQGAGYYPSPQNWNYYISYGHPPSAGETTVEFNIIQKSYFPDLLYDYPLHIIKSYDANGYDITNRVWSFVLNAGYAQTYVWQTANGSSNNVGWVSPGSTFGVLAAGGAWTTVTATQTAIASNMDFSGSSQISMAVFNLPGDDAGIQNGEDRPPVAGQPQIIINSSTLKVSKPGFDVTTASGTQVAFDSANMPSKIIAANDIYIPSGTSYYETGYYLSLETLVDCHFYDSSVIYYPRSIAKGAIPVVYRKNGTTIEFVNSGAPCRARFMIYASGKTDQTYGQNDVLRQFTDGSGNNVVQFLRPGCGPNPSFSDIVIDSRWPVVKIVKQGYFNVPDGTAESTISYDANGMFVFVRWCTLHGGGSNGNGVNRWTWSKFVRPPEFTLWAVDNGAFNVGGNTTICRYDNSSATFYSYRGLPKYQTYTSSTPTTAYDTAPIIGIRYYVFGVAMP
ncbi:hypothetical protein [Rhizobium oryziradicis]|uniref:Uncharacterized protein n=1 Tax=Rhizobium oryziradicis TaxID=1867956 RepID=A0A1Q8ZRE6_9HYPH|nr:hypothetical protein [Rhizobium oryziradicis]OLP44654.1 hypothetical protein BJF95_09145 [Rhizobium oryziradicis]